MPTTSNFGWTTPADTDLVKDGAAAIRTLGNGIDTSLVDLKGGTTGQILSKNSNTDLDYTWINNDQGDITEVQAGTGISVASGTGPVPVVTNTVATEFDAKGDLVVGTGADTFDRLAVGTNGHTLVADSSTSTGLKWAAPAGGSITWALLNSGGTSLSGVKTTVSFSAQKQLLIMFEGASSNSGQGYMAIRINDDNSAIYNSNGNKVIAQSSFVQNEQMSGINIANDSHIRAARMVADASSVMHGAVSIFGADTAGPKVFIVNGGETIVSDTGGQALNLQGTYNGSSAVTSISFSPIAGDWDAGTVYIWGGN